MNLGARVAEVRRSKGITQAFVAQAIGKSPQWLSNIEKGRRAIGAVELHQIAEVLGVDVGLFFAPTLHDTCDDEAATLESA